MADRSSQGLRIAVIGAETAEPLGQVINAMPAQSGVAVVVFCKTDPKIDALRRVSALPIVEVQGRIRVEPDRVFVVPPDCDAAFQRDELTVTPSSLPRASIDRLLRSLADEHGPQGTGVILSGLGNDGVVGIKRLKEAGGLTIVQTPDGEPSEMPRSAIATGLVDLVLPLLEIGQRLVAFDRRPMDDASPPVDEERRVPQATADSLQDILALVRIRSGHDFGSYKRATLYRRVARRIQVCQCDSTAAYHRYLREHPGELPNLLRDFLISVTNFFRDKEAFEALATHVIPRTFAGKGSAANVRVWVPGCSTGEEAYSIGMLMLEHASKLPEAPQLQIFATDIDEDALAAAREGRYPSSIAIDVSPERMQRFFTPDGAYHRVAKELREIVLFSPHNVLRDPPFSRLDLISCRNLLIYLNRDAQDRVIHAFHFGLRTDGHLFLGSSESAENNAMFSTVDGKRRLFVRQMASGSPDAMFTVGRWRPPVPSTPTATPVERVAAGDVHLKLVERYAPPSVLVNADLDVVHISERATKLLQVAAGEPTRQLLRMIHPALRLELRSAIYAARQSDRGSDSRIIRYDDSGTPRTLDIRVRTIDQPELGPGALLVMFDEIDPIAGSAGTEPVAHAALEPMMRELEEELRRTREQLRMTIEQYETSVEELKASNEELQAINEELRSATEELETSKEELQSVNEELTTLNHELNLKVEEVSQAHSDLQNLMTSTDIGVMFLDRALNIKRYTPRVQDLFNIIPSDLGRPFAHLTHRLEADDLPMLAQGVLSTLRTIEHEIRAREGRRYIARLLPYRSLDDRIGGVVLTFLEVSDLREAMDARRRYEAALQASEQRLQLALRAAPLLIVSEDEQLRTTWGYLLGRELAPHATAVTDLFASGHAEKFAAIARRVLESRQGERVELDLVIDGTPRTYDLRIERDEVGVTTVGFDISPSKLAESSLLESDKRKDEFLATLSHELRNPLTPLKVALDIAKLASGDRTKLDQALGIIERQTGQLSQLVDDLLDVSRITQGKIQIERVPIDPSSIIEAALEATRPLILQRQHQIAVDVPRLPRRVLGDQVRLTQVLTNLLNNAAKYTPDRGHIYLSASLDAARDQLVLRIRDDGQGIAQDMLSQIFDIFVQSRDERGRSRDGLGIGLNLVRRIVELHGGQVRAASDGLGSGSEFTVELPLAPDANSDVPSP